LGDAPYRIEGASWDTEREKFGDRVMHILADYAPNARSAGLHRQVLVPPDLEEIFGLTDGHIFHAELSLEQLFFMRPVPGYADYRTPIRGALPLRLRVPPGRRGHGGARLQRGA
jgi:phytoene dehydrogenase-like protein